MRKNLLMGAIMMLSCGGVVAGDLLSESFGSAPLPKGWVFYKEPWKLEQAPDPKDNPAWGDEKFLTVAPDTRWNTPAFKCEPFKCEPFKYYKMTFKSKAKSDKGYWGALFYDKDDKMLLADIYATVYGSPDWTDNTVMMRGREGNVSARGTFIAVDDPLMLDDVKIAEVDEKAVAGFLDDLYKTMPPIAFKASPDRWKRLPKTIQRLEKGGPIRFVMLGDSIINDTNNSNYEVLLRRMYPKAEIKVVPSVRSGTGCWYYEKPENFQPYVIDQKPDLLIIGGISQGKVEPIRNVIKMTREKLPDCEYLVMTGPVGPELRKFEKDDPTKLVEAPAYKLDEYGEGLKKMSDEEQVEYFDMAMPWHEYLAKSGKPFMWYHRDDVHANDRGKEILGRLLEAYFAPKK